MIKHICFDLDWTLAIQSNKFKKARDNLKYKVFAEVSNKDLDNETKKEFDELYQKYWSISSVFTKHFWKESDFWLKYFETLDKNKYYKTDKNIINTLLSLKEKVEISIFTNSKLEWTKKTLKIIKAEFNWFKFILSWDDITERKPALDWFQKIVELSWLKPQEILYIWDRENADIIPAKSVWMKTGLLWKKSNIADYSFMSFEEILNVL